MIVCGCNLFEWGTFLRRLDNFLMDLYSDEAGAQQLLDALMEVHPDTLQKVCSAVGEAPEIYRRLLGGFVFAAVHNIMPDVPARSAAAMFEAVTEWNRRKPEGA
jgi:hypothetical protein